MVYVCIKRKIYGDIWGYLLRGNRPTRDSVPPYKGLGMPEAVATSHLGQAE